MKVCRKTLQKTLTLQTVKQFMTDCLFHIVSFHQKLDVTRLLSLLSLVTSYFVEDCRTKANISIRKIKSSLKHQSEREKKRKRSKQSRW